MLTPDLGHHGMVVLEVYYSVAPTGTPGGRVLFADSLLTEGIHNLQHFPDDVIHSQTSGWADYIIAPGRRGCMWAPPLTDFLLSLHWGMPVLLQTTSRLGVTWPNSVLYLLMYHDGTPVLSMYTFLGRFVTSITRPQSLTLKFVHTSAP